MSSSTSCGTIIRSRMSSDAAARPPSRQPIDLDQRHETLEIRAVEREQSVHSAVEHRRDDIGIVDLATGDAMGRKDFNQAVERACPLFRNAERHPKPTNIADRGFHRQSGAVAWGRVTAARYSRNICELIQSVEPAPPSRARAPAAA